MAFTVRKSRNSARDAGSNTPPILLILPLHAPATYITCVAVPQALALAIGSVRDWEGLTPPEVLDIFVDSLRDADNVGNTFDDCNMVAAHLEALGNGRVQSREVCLHPNPSSCNSKRYPNLGGAKAKALHTHVHQPRPLLILFKYHHWGSFCTAKNRTTGNNPVPETFSRRYCSFCSEFWRSCIGIWHVIGCCHLPGVW